MQERFLAFGAMNVKSTVVAAILACSIGLVSLPLQASVMFFDDFDDGDVATNPGIGSGFQVSPRSIGAPGTTTLVESSGTLTIDNPGAPGNLQGGVATIDTFVYRVMQHDLAELRCPDVVTNINMSQLGSAAHFDISNIAL